MEPLLFYYKFCKKKILAWNEIELSDLAAKSHTKIDIGNNMTISHLTEIM